MSKKQRRRPTLKERMTPCIICLHPLSQRHHLLSFSIHGENAIGTIQLCANCHDMYHLFERYAQRKQKKHKDGNMRLFEVPTEEDRLIEKLGNDPVHKPLVRLAAHTTRLIYLFRLDGTNSDFDSYSEKDKNEVYVCWNFITNFKQYVERERQKMNEWFRANSSGIMASFFEGGTETDEQ